VVSQFIFKKLMSVIVLVAVFLIASVFFVACSDDPPSNDEGVVYGVTFSTGIDEWVVEDQAVEKGGKIIEPEVYLREGYILKGWKIGEMMWNFPTDTVQESIELVAVWEVDTISWEYTDGLSFVYNNGADGYEVSEYAGESKNVKIPLYFNGSSGVKKVTRLGEKVFDGLEIVAIELPSSINFIGEYAFRGTKIEEIVLPQDLKRLGSYALAGNENFKRVVFNNSVDSLVLGEYAFSGCINFSEFVVPDNVVEIGNNCFDSSGLASIIFGSKTSLYSIGMGAFKNTNLEGAVIPDSVKVIGNEAFKGCENMLYAVVPSGLTTVGENVFADCTKFSNIYYTQEKPTFSQNNYTGLDKYLEFSYSKSDKGESGYWHYSTMGVPEVYRNIKEVCVDISSLSEVFSGGRDYTDYIIVVRQFLSTGNGDCKYYSKESEIDENGMANIKVDEYGNGEYNIEVYYASTINYDDVDYGVVMARNIDITKNDVILINPNSVTCTIEVTYGK